jgi:hypothetical protein
MGFTIVVNDVVQAPEAKSLVRGEGTADGDDLAGEVHITFGGDVFGSGGEEGARDIEGR